MGGVGKAAAAAAVCIMDSGKCTGLVWYLFCYWGSVAWFVSMELGLWGGARRMTQSATERKTGGEKEDSIGYM